MPFGPELFLQPSFSLQEAGVNMKRLALLLFVSFVCAHAASVPPQGQFAAGREYLYGYEAQAISAVPGVSKEVAGIKIAADARIQMKANNVCLLQLEEIHLYKIQDETEDPAAQQMDDKLQILEDSVAAPMKEQLKKPVQFDYVDGEVSNIKTANDDAGWSENAKKAALEMINVNIAGTNDLNEPKTKNVVSTTVVHQKKHYRVMEVGIAGNCESVYNVKVKEPVPSIVDKQVQSTRYMLEITKTRDLMTCAKQIQHSQVSILSGKKCDWCGGAETPAWGKKEGEEEEMETIQERPGEPAQSTQKGEDVLKGVSQVKFSISLKDHNKFIIDRVEGKGQHVFMPFGAKGGKAATFVNQVLVLKSNQETPAEHQIPDIQNFKAHPEGLAYIFQEWDMHRHDSQENPELVSEDGDHMSAIREEVNNYLETIYNALENDTTLEKGAVEFIYMVRALKELSPSELSNVFDRLGKKAQSDTKEQTAKKKILLDGLIQVESRKSVEILTKQIERQKFGNEEASQIISTIALTKSPTEEMLDSVLRLCKELNGIAALKQVRETCWLGFGSLVHRACKINQVCSEEKIKIYSRNLLAGVDLPSNDDKQMCLKAIGNAGIVMKTADATVDSVNKIAEIVMSNAGIELRVQAIYSFRRVAKSEQKRIIPILASVIKNDCEDHRVRIAAFVVVMDSEPTPDIIQSLVVDLHKDKSRQVASFIYTHLQGIAANRQHCNLALLAAARKAIITLKPVVMGLQYSRKLTWDPTFIDQKVGLRTEASIIGTRDSPLPAGGSVKIGAVVLNRQMNIMEAGFHAEGLRDIVEKIFGVATPARPPKKEREMDQNRRDPGEKTPAERDLDALDRDLPTTRAHYNPHQAKVAGYLKLFGNELRTITLDQVTIWSVLEGAYQKMASIMAGNTEGMNVTAIRKIISIGRGTHKIPTAIGIPVALWFDTAAVIDMDVKVQAKMSCTDVLGNKCTNLRNNFIEGTITTRPRIALATLGKMKVIMDDVVSGLAIDGTVKAAAALSGTIYADHPNHFYSFKFDAPTTERQVISIHSKPYTFTATKPHNKVNQVEQRGGHPMKVRKIMGKLMSPQPATWAYRFGKESLGVEVEVNTRHVPRVKCSATNGVTQLLFSPMELNAIVRPGINAAEQVTGHIKLETEYLTQDMYEGFKNHFLSKQSFSPACNCKQYAKTWTARREDWRYECGTLQGDACNNSTWCGGTCGAGTGGTGTCGADTHDTGTRSEAPLFLNCPHGPVHCEVQGSHFDSGCHRIHHPDNGVPLHHIYFDISTVGASLPIRRLLSRISLDQHDEFLKAIRWDTMAFSTPEKAPRSLEKVQDFQAMCVQGELEHPPYAATLPAAHLDRIGGLPDVVRDARVLFKLNTQWGKSCYDDQKMQIRGHVKRSKKQLEAWTCDNLHMQQCLKDFGQNKTYTPACKSVRRDREELRAIHAELTHNECVKPTWKATFYRTLDTIKHWLWDHAVMEQAEELNQCKVVLTGELEKDNCKLNVSIKHGHNNDKFEGIRIPRLIQDLGILSPYQLQQHRIMDMYFEPLGGRNMNKCKALKDGTIITFDKVHYNYNQSTCDHILSKDCSDKERYVVLTRKLSANSTKKIVTVYVNNTKIQFVPHISNSSIMMKVNDSVDVDLGPRKKIIIKENGTDIQIRKLEHKKKQIMDTCNPICQDNQCPESPNQCMYMSEIEWARWNYLFLHIQADMSIFQRCLVPPPFPIVVYSSPIYINCKSCPNPINSIMLFATEQELKVFTDGSNVKVELPQKYKNVQCGLCGDFNGEITEEFSGPQREQYRNAQRFGRSFQHTTEQCAKEDQCAPAMEFAFETQVILPANDKKFACITKRPVPKCLPPCTATEEEDIEAEFVCTEHEATYNPFTGTSREELIAKYDRKAPDYKRTIPMAKKCGK